MAIGLRVALTGGIGSGKTTVTDIFETYGTPVIDADKISHQLVEPGRPALNDIKNILGAQFIKADGTLDRSGLGRHIFNSAIDKLRLEEIIHPRVRQEILQQLATFNTEYCIISVPLLVETGFHDIADRILLIDTSQKLQIKRTCTRDNIKSDRVKMILSQQASRTERTAIADDIIENNGTIDNLVKQIAQYHQKYCRIGLSRLSDGIQESEIKS